GGSTRRHPLPEREEFARLPGREFRRNRGEQLGPWLRRIAEQQVRPVLAQHSLRGRRQHLWRLPTSHRIDLEVQLHPVRKVGREQRRARRTVDRDRVVRRIRLVFVEGAGVLDAEGRQHAAIEPPQGDAEVFFAVGAEGGLALRLFHL